MKGNHSYRTLKTILGVLLVIGVVYLSNTFSNEYGLEYRQGGYNEAELPAGLRDRIYRSYKTSAKQNHNSLDNKILQLNAQREAAQISGFTNRYMPYWPVAGVESRITSVFSEDRGNRRHEGIDIGIPEGTPVVAAFTGFFYKGGSEGKSGLGKYVYLKHDNGLITYYGHLKDWAPIQDGTKVSGGSIIGWSGNTGNSTGPHLHFSIKSTNGFLNPLDFYSYSHAQKLR